MQTSLTGSKQTVGFVPQAELLVIVLSLIFPDGIPHGVCKHEQTKQCEYQKGFVHGFLFPSKCNFALASRFAFRANKASANKIVTIPLKLRSSCRASVKTACNSEGRIVIVIRSLFMPHTFAY